MGKHPPGMTTVCIYIDESRRSYLEMRRKRLDWSMSATAGAALEFWLRNGAPPLSEIDHGAPPWVEQTKPGSNGRSEKGSAHTEAEKAEAEYLIRHSLTAAQKAGATKRAAAIKRGHGKAGKR